MYILIRSIYAIQVCFFTYPFYFLCGLTNVKKKKVESGSLIRRATYVCTIHISSSRTVYFGSRLSSSGLCIWVAQLSMFCLLRLWGREHTSIMIEKDKMKKRAFWSDYFNVLLLYVYAEYRTNLAALVSVQNWQEQSLLSLRHIWIG